MNSTTRSFKESTRAPLRGFKESTRAPLSDSRKYCICNFLCKQCNNVQQIKIIPQFNEIPNVYKCSRCKVFTSKLVFTGPIKEEILVKHTWVTVPEIPKFTADILVPKRVIPVSDYSVKKPMPLIRDRFFSPIQDNRHEIEKQLRNEQKQLMNARLNPDFIMRS
jgi:hypothetical protein